MAPDHELIAAVITALKSDATVSHFVGTKVYDRPPEKKAGEVDVGSPYISIGPTSSIPNDVDCIDGEDITFQVDVWSWGSGEAYSAAECRKISDAVKRALHNADIPLSDNALAGILLDLKTTRRDPDMTNHGILQFTATVEIPD